MGKHSVFFLTSEKMSQVGNNTVALMITSPPYWDLKNYGTEKQIGYDETYKEYLKRLYEVWTETYRVLSKKGTAIININTRSYKKQLVPIPYDIIKQMKTIGFKFRDVHYWHKSSGIPLINNFGDHFEYFLIFTKGENVKCNDFSFFDYKIDPSIPRTNIWNINKKFGSIGKRFMKHPAIFPVEYISRMIKIFTDENDVVLDPFLGSGTTLISCLQTNRLCIGYELNKQSYLPLIKARLLDNGLDNNKIDFT